MGDVKQYVVYQVFAGGVESRLAGFGTKKQAVDMARSMKAEGKKFVVRPVTIDGILDVVWPALKKNPAPKRKTAARTQRAAESYVRRQSQITKKAPSKRLKKRRTVNLQSPRGVFPNPSPRKYTFYPVGTRVKMGDGYGEDAGKLGIVWNARETSDIGYPHHYKVMLDSGFMAFGGKWVSDIKKSRAARKNPDSVHFDIDVNSHNARGAKARTRTNPAPRKSPKTWIFVQKAYGKDDWSYLGYFDDTPDGSARAIEYAKAYHVKDPRAKIRVFTGPMK